MNNKQSKVVLAIIIPEKVSNISVEDSPIEVGSSYK